MCKFIAHYHCLDGSRLSLQNICGFITLRSRRYPDVGRSTSKGALAWSLMSFLTWTTPQSTDVMDAHTLHFLTERTSCQSLESLERHTQESPNDHHCKNKIVKFMHTQTLIWKRTIITISKGNLLFEGSMFRLQSFGRVNAHCSTVFANLKPWICKWFFSPHVDWGGYRMRPSWFCGLTSNTHSDVEKLQFQLWKMFFLKLTTSADFELATANLSRN